MTLHPGAWTAWLGAVAVVAFAVSNPLLLLVALGAVVLVHLAGPPDDSPAGRAVRLFLWVGVVLLVLRLGFVALLADQGETVLFALPRLELPGGLGFGGPVTAEVLVANATAGLRVLVVLAAFGVFNARVDLSRLVRLVPAPFRDAGLVVSIGAAFVPGLLRTVADVRDAQRLRGERGLGALAPSLVVPVLGLSLERALLLAESMDARGFGRAATVPLPRGALLFGTGGVVAGLAVWVAGLETIATALVAAGGLALAFALRTVARASRTTHLASDPWRARDTLVTTFAAAAAVGAFVVPGVGYDAYPVVSAPAFSLVASLPALLLAAPLAAEVRR